MAFKKKLKRTMPFEEIFADMGNLSSFDAPHFEGTLEFPISRNVFYIFGALSLVIGLLLGARAGYLTLLEGSAYAARADENHLNHNTIIPERGVIYDRTGMPLAFNVPGFRVVVAADIVHDDDFMKNIGNLAALLNRDTTELAEFISAHQQGKEIVVGLIREWAAANAIITQFKDTESIRVEPTPLRAYDSHPAFSHVLGYVSRVTKEDVEEDTSLLAWGEIGRSGIERAYDAVLRGRLGIKIVEIDSQNTILSEGIYQEEERGESITLTLSADLQKVVYEAVGRIVEDRGFQGGSAVALDARTGDVLSLISYPGYDPNVMSAGRPYERVIEILSGKRHPLFFRAIAGLYPPASTIKPFLAAAALEERIISSETRIYTDGQLVFPNPFNPDNPTIFNDWKNHGALAMRRAIAVSSNVYFFTIGGGFGDQEGLGHARIKKYLQEFAFGSRTGIDIEGELAGIVPDEVWKADRYPNDPLWRIGDTYNMSIGQGGMLATPLQVARATLSIARDGLLFQPRLVADTSAADSERIAVSEQSFAVVKEGMRRAVSEGTARGVSGISIPVAAKTGTAELGKTGRVHSWFIGFFPADEPEVVLVINMESGPASNLVGATAAAHEILQWYVRTGKSALGLSEAGSYPQVTIDR